MHVALPTWDCGELTTVWVGIGIHGWIARAAGAHQAVLRNEIHDHFFNIVLLAVDVP